MSRIILFFFFIPAVVFAQLENKAPHYPVLNKTGNLADDELNWKKAIEEWKTSYPDEFEILEELRIGNPEEITNYNVVNVADELMVKNSKSSGTTIYSPPIDLNDPGLFKLKSIKAVGIRKEASLAEINYYLDEAKNEFNRADVIVDLDNNFWYIIPRNNHFEPIVKIINFNKNILEAENCNTCAPVQFFLIALTDKKLTIQIPSKEDTEYFSYEFEFIK